MNALIALLPGGRLQGSPSPHPGLLVLTAPHAAAAAMLAFAAQLALSYEQVRVLDGGNRFNSYKAAAALRGLGAENLSQALQRIQVARAFTCYQVAALLEKTPELPAPTLVLDLLDTFFDESAPLDERLRLAQECAGRLRQLSQQAPVIASLRPPPPGQPDPTGLLEIIQQAADLQWSPYEAPRPFNPPLLE